jgi:hypothetical protein
MEKLRREALSKDSIAMKISASLSAALLMSIGFANAADPPPLKEGLWTVHTLSTDNPGVRTRENTATICRNHAYDQHVHSIARSKTGCTTINETLLGGQYTVQMHCVVKGTVVESRGVTTYRGDTSAHSESHATFAPAMDGLTETSMIQDQKYLGACPAGLQPGDMTSSNGAVQHLWKH